MVAIARAHSHVWLRRALVEVKKRELDLLQGTRYKSWKPKGSNNPVFSAVQSVRSSNACINTHPKQN